MMIKILKVKQSKNKEFIGKVFEVVGTKKARAGEKCYIVNTKLGIRLFVIDDCEKLENVLMLKRA